MKKYLVTGGSGFIGSYIVEEIKKRGDRAIIYDNKADKRNDVTNLKRLIEVSKGCDGVFHLAAIPSVQYSIENPKETFNINYNGTLNVLEAMRVNKINSLVYSSSSAVYGDQDILPISEKSNLNFKSPYALQKYMGELLCNMYSNLYGIKTVSLRYFNVYGLGQSSQGAYASVIAKFLELNKSSQDLTITGDGEQTRDFVHVTDVARANLISMRNINKANGQAFNIGSGSKISINTIAKIIGGNIKYIKARIEPKNSLADISKAKEILKWEPKVKFDKGLLKIIKSI